jgi:hypothetical protein
MAHNKKIDYKYFVMALEDLEQLCCEIKKSQHIGLVRTIEQEAYRLRQDLQDLRERASVRDQI